MSEAWTLLAETDDDLPPMHSFLVEKLARKMRSKWNQTDRVQIEYKHGAQWVSTGKGISFPDDRKLVSPEGGALELVSMAFELSEKYDHKASIRVRAFGESQSGNTAKELWPMGLSFNEESDPDDPTNPKKNAKAETHATNSVLRDMANDMREDRKSAVEQTIKITEVVMNMADSARQNTSDLVKIRMLELENEREKREAEAQAREDEVSARRADRFWDEFMTRGGNLFDRIVSSKMGLGDTLKGTYAERLAAILGAIEDSKMDAAKEVVGQDMWDLIQAAAKKGVTDEAFRELVKRMVAAMPDGESHQMVFMRLAGAVGDQAPIAALAKLLTEASD